MPSGQVPISPCDVWVKGCETKLGAGQWETKVRLREPFSTAAQNLDTLADVCVVDMHWHHGAFGEVHEEAGCFGELIKQSPQNCNGRRQARATNPPGAIGPSSTFSTTADRIDGENQSCALLLLASCSISYLFSLNVRNFWQVRQIQKLISKFYDILNLRCFKNQPLARLVDGAANHITVPNRLSNSTHSEF